MNDATLQGFRQMADAMGCGKNKDWAICIRRNGRLLVQAFGYSQADAERCAKYYKGGEAVHESVVLNERPIAERMGLTKEGK
jgi:hypothetical protein